VYVWVRARARGRDNAIGPDGGPAMREGLARLTSLEALRLGSASRSLTYSRTDSTTHWLEPARLPIPLLAHLLAGLRLARARLSFSFARSLAHSLACSLAHCSLARFPRSLAPPSLTDFFTRLLNHSLTF
jgi:hypothetical protein